MDRIHRLLGPDVTLYTDYRELIEKADVEAVTSSCPITCTCPPRWLRPRQACTSSQKRLWPGTSMNATG